MHGLHTYSWLLQVMGATVGLDEDAVRGWPMLVADHHVTAFLQVRPSSGFGRQLLPTMRLCAGSSLVINTLLHASCWQVRAFWCPASYQ